MHLSEILLFRHPENGPQLGPWQVETSSSSLAACQLAGSRAWWGEQSCYPCPVPGVPSTVQGPSSKPLTMEGNSGVASRPETTLNTR